jgi:two-component system, OmpR family, response regulator QseB
VRLLLTEDDTMIGEAVQRGLRQLGFALDWVRDGAAAEQALALEPYDLLLLDLGLPRKSGLELLRDLRRRGSAIPVVVLTARDATTDRVAGLDAGADDYVVKPFELAELAARIRAVLRRRNGRSNPRLEHRGVTLDPATREVTQDGQPVPLSAREFAVLLALMQHPDRVLSRARIEEHLYGWGEEIESNVVEVYIHALRRKLGTGFIRTIRGAGYRLEPA